MGLGARRNLGWRSPLGTSGLRLRQSSRGFVQGPPLPSEQRGSEKRAAHPTSFWLEKGFFNPNRV